MLPKTSKTETGVREYNKLPNKVGMIDVEKERRIYVLALATLESSREKLEKAVKFYKAGK